MKEHILDLEKWVGLEKSFQPHYQFEKPLEFYSLVNYYMEYNFDEKHNPERYMTKLRYAVQFANKSLMADKLGIDIEKVESEDFEKSFIKIACSYNDLEIVGNEILVTDSLKKSFNNRVEDKNFLYEKVAKEAYNLIIE